MPRAPRRAESAPSSSRPPRGRAGGPAGERAPPRPAALARPEPPPPAAAQLSSPRAEASSPSVLLPCPGPASRSLPDQCPRETEGKRGADPPGWRGSPGETSLITVRPPSLPFPSGFPGALSRAGGGGAAAPASRSSLAQARGGSGIGTRIPEAGDPKVRAATGRAVNVVPESRSCGG